MQTSSATLHIAPPISMCDVQKRCAYGRGTSCALVRPREVLREFSTCSGFSLSQEFVFKARPKKKQDKGSNQVSFSCSEEDLACGPHMTGARRKYWKFSGAIARPSISLNADYACIYGSNVPKMYLRLRYILGTNGILRCRKPRNQENHGRTKLGTS